MTHSKSLKETTLWQLYELNEKDNARKSWTEEVYDSACFCLKDVRKTFDNYTLHDETHVLNILDIMSGLLGNKIKELTVGEIELLIIAASLHDIGMVYNDEDRKSSLSDAERLLAYCSSHPDLRSNNVEDWEELDKQNYLRWLHPFRISDVLKKEEWRKLFGTRPKELVPDKIIIAVCQSHGESPEKLRKNATDDKGDLRYLRYKEIDPLFCALLLRLADILDFDDSRAPSILFSYAGNNEKSIEEWKKHSASMGFNFPDTPSTDDLPYGALFMDPTIERSANLFLDWIDEELLNSRSLLRFTCNRWKDFPFPYQVDRKEIERKGYDFGDFKITMDQEQIINLLVGENLYRDHTVFVRELLQNSIDATLLRAKLDPSFDEKLASDEARIDLWEWWDDNGDLWFRIDDRGTGMTRGMLEKYFLKAGSSYYNSKEIKRDLNGKSYSSISRFGIGFLACFLCGSEAYVSTTYWDPKKNMKDMLQYGVKSNESSSFGLRLDVVGMNGYYTLRNQAIADNCADPLQAPPITYPHLDDLEEIDGFRTDAGTSIVIKLDPRQLGSAILLEEARRWTCFPRMPIYYNGKRLSLTQDEFVAIAREEQGSREYELSDDEKQEFDSFFPERKGYYPTIRENVEIFEADQVIGLPRAKVVILDTQVLIPEGISLCRGDRIYKCTGNSYLHKPSITFYVEDDSVDDLELSFQSKDDRKIYDSIPPKRNIGAFIRYGWQGISVYNDNFALKRFKCQTILILAGEDEIPIFKLNRENYNVIPLKMAVFVLGLLGNRYEYGDLPSFHVGDFYMYTLKYWREINTSDFLKWIDLPTMKHYQEFVNAIKEFNLSGTELPQPLGDKIGGKMYPFWTRSSMDLRFYFLACLELYYKIIVDYSNYQLKLSKYEYPDNETRFDLFPIMLFAYGKTEEDCSILCSSNPYERLVFTADHPFMEWVLKNSEKLNRYFPRHLNQIMWAINNYEVESVIDVVNTAIEQLSKTAYRYGIDASTCPNLKKEDFWEPKTKV